MRHMALALILGQRRTDRLPPARSTTAAALQDPSRCRFFVWADGLNAMGQPVPPGGYERARALDPTFGDRTLYDGGSNGGGGGGAFGGGGGGGDKGTCFSCGQPGACGGAAQAGDAVGVH